MRSALIKLGIVMPVAIVVMGGAPASAFLGRLSLVNGAGFPGVHIVKDRIVGAAMVAIAPDQGPVVDDGHGRQ